MADKRTTTTTITAFHQPSTRTLVNQLQWSFVNVSLVLYMFNGNSAMPIVSPFPSFLVLLLTAPILISTYRWRSPFATKGNHGAQAFTRQNLYLYLKKKSPWTIIPSEHACLFCSFVRTHSRMRTAHDNNNHYLRIELHTRTILFPVYFYPCEFTKNKVL